MRSGRRYSRRYAVDLEHPLNDQRFSWILGLPPFMSPNEVTANTVFDLVAGYYRATRDGTFSNSTTIFGNTLGWNLNGSVKSVRIAATELTTPQRVTFACSFKNDTARNYYLFHKGDGSTNANSAFGVWRIGANLQAGYNSGSGWNYATSDGNYYDGLWHRMLTTYNGTTGYGAIYIDGILKGSFTTVMTIPATATYPYAWGYSAASANGVVDFIADMSIWTRDLNDAEALQDYIHAFSGYTRNDSPLTWNRARLLTSNPNVEVSFSTSVTVGETLTDLSLGEFTTELTATGDASGLGTVDPSAPAEFDTAVSVNQNFGAGQPTLVGFTTNVAVDDTTTAGAPATFSTALNVQQALTTIPGGDRRIVSQRRYRR